MSGVPLVSLPWFEGPLDLLLALVHKNNIDIADLPIADLTGQYLEYLSQAEHLDMELGSEFAYMASMLIHIKSHCLLGRDPELAARQEDPRQELVRQLLAHDQLHRCVDDLDQRLESRKNTWTRSSMGDFAPREEPDEPDAPVNVLHVLRLARKALDVARTYKAVNPGESVTISEMVLWLEARILPLKAMPDARPLLEGWPDSDHRSTLFLAMLELAKQARIDLDQKECFGPISLIRVLPTGSKSSGLD
jgi:segregation and condensation protein A